MSAPDAARAAAPEASRARARAEAALLALTVVWGGTFVISKLGLKDVSPMFLIALRFSAASLILLAIAPKAILPLTLPQLRTGAVLGGFLFAGFAAQTVGLQYTTASKSAFITGMMVIFVPLLQILVERKPPRLGNLVGVAVVTAGLWLLTSPDVGGFNVGDLLTLLSAALFGMYIVDLDLVSGAMNTARLTFLQLATTAVGAWGGVLLFEEVRWSPSPGLYATLAYLVLLATVLAMYVQTRFQKDTTPTRAAIIFTVEPVFAAAIAWMVLDEALGPAALAGAGLILGGVLVSELSDGIPLLNRTWGRPGPPAR